MSSAAPASVVHPRAAHLARYRFAWLLGFVLLCLSGTLLAAWQMRHWGDALSPVDPFSEANALREVDGFRVQGLLHDSGLGNALFGGRYPDEGFVTTQGEMRARSLTPTGVYTHYPPGPEYLLYAAEALFGPEPVSRLRLLPLGVCAAAAVFFGFSIRRRFGAAVGWLVVLACTMVAPFHDVNSSVHFMGYALALLLVETGIAVGRNRLRWPYFLLGFAQGWLSFDYVFLAVLTPLAVEASLPFICPEHHARWRLALLRCGLAGAGFLVAHALHFAEVWSFYGSFQPALADLHDSARYRAGADEVHGTLRTLKVGLLLLGFYVISPYPVSVGFLHPVPAFSAVHAFRFLGITLGVWWPAIAVVLACIDVHRRHRGRAPLDLLRRWSAVGAIGIGVSCLWWVVMQNHAAVHVHLLYRHLTVCFLLWAMFLAVLTAPLLPGLAGAARQAVRGTLRGHHSRGLARQGRVVVHGRDP